jgi:hypothetical protein
MRTVTMFGTEFRLVEAPDLKAPHVSALLPEGPIVFFERGGVWRTLSDRKRTSPKIEAKLNQVLVALMGDVQ